MLDIQFIRDNAKLVEEKSKQKGYPVDVEKLLDLDKTRRNLLSDVETLRQKRNEISGGSKGKKPSAKDIETGKDLKEKIAVVEAKLTKVEENYLTLLKLVPNMPLEGVPIGTSEDDNKVEYERGDKPNFDFEPKNHAELAEQRGWLDKVRAAKVTGSRFAYIKGDLVKLQLALINWVTDVLTNEKLLRKIANEAGLKNMSSRPFVLVLPPLMINTNMYDAMDRLEPRDDRYKIEGEELWLQGSAEHVMGSMHAGEILTQDDLPLRYLGFATSFRKEAGTYGKDMEGIIRMHQFDKLEMESFTEGKDGTNEHLFLIGIQEYILLQLGLPYRKLLKCTADIGKPNARGVDMDAWLPGQNKYRETHTADYMTDYQARRLKTRVENGETLELVHTNDATALALGRGMVAIIENYQTAKGEVKVPKVLRSYMGGRKVI